MAEAGADVVIADCRIVEGIEIAERIQKTYGVQATAIEVDIGDKSSVNKMLDQAEAWLPGVDILINNAALTVEAGPGMTEDYFATFEDYPQDAWESALRTNLSGVFYCTQGFGSRVISRGVSGVVINVSSIYGLVGPDHRLYNRDKNSDANVGQFNTPLSYSATKGALISMTRYLATYWAKDNIRVNSVTLGGVYNGHDAEFVKQYSYRTPMGRMARKEEYCGAIQFLASNASSYMTGANLVIDGGWTAW
jgi:NAD(P)-dependent dehydrogenase (short-subunit alcohol dehydrogenase family)